MILEAKYVTYGSVEGLRIRVRRVIPSRLVPEDSALCLVAILSAQAVAEYSSRSVSSLQSASTQPLLERLKSYVPLGLARPSEI